MLVEPSDLHQAIPTGPPSPSPASLFPTQLLYLAVNLVQGSPQDVLQPHSPVVGQIPGGHPCLFQEHAHVAQLQELGLSHLRCLVSQAASPLSMSLRPKGTSGGGSLLWPINEDRGTPHPV